MSRVETGVRSGAPKMLQSKLCQFRDQLGPTEGMLYEHYSVEGDTYARLNIQADSQSQLCQLQS
jgi:hypothetical protein